MLPYVEKKDFYRRLVFIAIPIIIQNFILSLLNAVDVIMVGQLGTIPIAGVGLSNQIFFLLTFFVFGINSSASIFCSQYWGKKDLNSVNKIFKLSFLASFAFGFVFFIVSFMIPDFILRLYTNDKEVINTGMGYLRIVSISYLFTVITSNLVSILRSMEIVKSGMIVSIISLFINTGLNYIFIFGKFGFPALGVYGAGLATVIARSIELILLISLILIRKYPLKLNIKQIFIIDKELAKNFFKIALPVILSEIVWSVGITVYNAIYARIGTEQIAAINMVSTIESLGFVLFIGISSAGGILIGKKIGENKNDIAFKLSKRVLLIGMFGAILTGFFVFLFRDFIFSFYKVSPDTLIYAEKILIVLCCVLWLKVSNMILFVAIIRSGGDTKFEFITISASMWLIGVPLAAIGGLIFKLPIHYVIILVMGEEIFKFVFCFLRFISKKWINNLAVDKIPESLNEA
ncbi:MAG: hypothetical protein A2086_07950 [Spirochaetes bacterium GWD1_27_9]|nr:MAG: hypothetical protein A2Y34_04735 [Spirochaetes bacterium GWC1_27_15]OHD36738.1 MAG: hypothetical protein A2086_07950 [Spirochaetes bacterium GWD1_27_9]